MRDLAKNNDGSGANVANGNGTTGDNVGATGKIDTTELSASELYRLGRGLCVGVYGIKIDKRRGVALPEAAVEAGKAADASDETKSAALDAQAELAERTSDGLEDAPPDWERAVELAAKPAEAGIRSRSLRWGTRRRKASAVSRKAPHRPLSVAPSTRF